MFLYWYSNWAFFGIISICRFLKAGGSPERVVQLLSDNYTGVAQTVNLLAEWMIQAGVDIKEVQEMVESHLKEMIIRTFDPKKADSIFTDEGEVGGNWPKKERENKQQTVLT